METCISYLAFKYISPATQALILKELNIRIESEEEARVVADSLVLQGNLVSALLDSTDARIREYTCNIVATLASYESTPWALAACTDIVSLLSDENIQSLHSWWSDSNSVGATISLHAAAKPLMRLLYHEQVRSFIKRNRGLALSSATIEICFSYLAFKYISPATKTLILNELEMRVESQQDALMVVQSLVVQLDLVAELLDSSDTRIRHYMCSILGTLASPSDSTSWVVEVCPRIVSLISGNDIEVRQAALYAVARISETPHGIQALGATKIWDRFPKHLESWNFEFLQFIVTILRNLSHYEVASLRVAGPSGADCEARRHAIYALSKISYWSQGARAVAEATAAEDVADLMASADTETRRWSCKMLSNLEFHGFTSAVRLSSELCPQIFPLLSDDDAHVREGAILALSKISRPLIPQELGLTVESDEDARVMAHSPVQQWDQLLDSSDARIRRYTCNMLGKVAASYEEVLPRLVLFLLSDEDREVQESALHAVVKISETPDGVRSVVSSNSWQYFPKRLNPRVRQLLHSLLGHLSDYVVASLKNRGVALSREMMETCLSYLAYKYSSPATKTLILKELEMRVESEQDALMVVQSLVVQLDLVAELLDSSDTRIRHHMCSILGTLASLSDSTSWVVEVCPRIVSLISGNDIEVRQAALYAVARISETPHGVQALGATKIWKYFPKRLDSSNSEVRQFIVTILRNLSHYEVASLRVTGPSDPDIEVRRRAVHALSEITYWPEGTQAAAEARALEYAAALLDSCDTETRRWTCEMLRNMAFNGFARQLSLELCPQIFSLLSDDDQDVRETALLALSTCAWGPLQLHGMSYRSPYGGVMTDAWVGQAGVHDER
ncbi:armadillo-type protein [Mycena leptocephala]|nr:armadillo-type protein [Mycena leptocephala]